MEPLEPFFQFYWGRSQHWLRWMRNAGRLTVWTRFFSFSIGKRWPVDDGWPQ